MENALSAICDAIYRRVLLFVCSMNHIPPYLFLSREDDDDVRDIGKHDFRSVALHPMLSNANRPIKRVVQGKSSQERSSDRDNITRAHLTHVYTSTTCLLVN